jgi:integrase
MKNGKEHRVPLSTSALKLLKSLPRSGELLFPGPTGKAMSDMALTVRMGKMKVDAVPHGFRSTFRDWAAERTAYPHEMAEMALAHTIPSKTEADYRRGDLLAKRKRMMQDWANFCGKVAVPADYVIPMQRAG